jgi:cell division septation protein DedD
MPAATNQPASAIPPLKARNAAERPQPYWQVTASPNITAGALVRGLNAKGFNASLLGSREDPLVRVIVGPYADAQALEKAKGELIAAGVTPVRVW